MKKLFPQFLLYTITVSSLMAQQTDSLPPRVYSLDSLPAIKDASRIRKQVMEGSTTALAYLEVHTTTLEPGQSPHPPHVHADMDELIIIKEGQVRITINGVSKVMGPGSVGFATAGDEHGTINAAETKATYYLLKYKSKLPTDMARAKQNGGSFMLNWNDLELKKTEKGGRRDFFNRPTSQLVKFEMHTTALNAGLASHAAHTHKEEEIIILLRGSGEMQIGNNFYKAKAGDLVFLSSGIPHAFMNTGNEQCEYFAFQWRN